MKFNNFLDKQICNDIINSKKDFKPSAIIGHTVKVDNDARTSWTTTFKCGENKHITKIINRICDKLSIIPKQIEPVQLSRYSEGQQYKYHNDYFDTKKCNIKNQRHYTILIYLNDVPMCDGGSTDFYYGDNFQPIIGNALIWSNLNNDLTINKKMLHSGKPILRGYKYILTIWTRINPI